MKHVLINLATDTAGIYHTKKAIADILSITTKTLIRKGSENSIIRYKGYIICLNVPEYKAISKQRSTSF
jgi:hypothetical protein